MIIILSSALSILTGIMMWRLAEKDRRGWYLSIFNQCIWLWFIIVSQSWGLLPLNAWMVVVAVRGLRKWKDADLTNQITPDRSS